MAKRLLVAVVLALTLVALTLPTTSWAGDIFHFRGKSAAAFFSSTDAAECIFTDVFLSASDDRFQNPPGPGDSASAAFIVISQFDTCTSTLLLDAFGFASLAAPEFQVSGKLQSATLDATIEVFDFVSGTSFNVVVDLTWTSTGGLSRENSHFHFQVPGFKINSHFNGTFREAQASGSVSAGATNFTPDPSLFAQIQSLKSGTVVID